MRTIIRGKRIIPPAKSSPPKKKSAAKSVKRCSVLINSHVFVHNVTPSQTIGNILFHTIPHLKYKSCSSMLASLTTAVELLTQLLDDPRKPTKQIKGILKLVENAKLKIKETLNPENPEVREKLITYIVEQVMRCEGLGALHGFVEVVPKKSYKG